MKYQPGFTDFFMSPVTGRIILPMMPDLNKNYVWLGNRDDRPLPSPIIIDLRLEVVDIRRRLSETRFILQAASENFDSSQALNELIPGILRHTDGIVAIAIPWVDYVPPILPEKNIWIGNADDEPEPYPRIFLENLPSMLSVDPTKLLGAYNLYRGSPNPLTLGIPEIVKTLHITNMADLEEGYLWLGTNSSDPLNFGSNRPVPIIILPLANMANLPDGKVWVGDGGDRPVPSDILTEIQGEIDDINDEITTINENITNINTELGDINIELGDINLNIESIFDSLLEINAEIGDINIDIESLFDLVSDITVDFGDIIIRLDGLDDIVADLQAQIDTNVASGLDHLADLQLQIDTAIASGLDSLATINLRLDALELSVTTINTTITTIQSDITTIQTSITSILSDITSIFSSLSTITSQITTILSDITAINTAISTITSDITSIYSSISTINATLTSLSSLITDIQGDITNITTVLLPDIYTYIDTEITNITSNFIAGGVVDMNDNRIINLPCDPEEDDDAISFCFLWHVLHDEVNVLWS